MKPAIILFLFFSLLTGFVYPVIVTGIAQILFPFQANGSLTEHGSHLIGQSFTHPKYFWGRPSSTPDFPYNAANSGASNLGLSNPDFLTAIKQRMSIYQHTAPIPVELLQSSGSGLDPEISPNAAFYQISRIAQARNIPESQIHVLIEQSIKHKSFGILGEPRVNVLELNLALDAHK